MGGSQYLLSVYRLHGVILTSIICLTNLSAALYLFMVFIGSCMTGFDVLANYHSDLESTIRKSRSRLSSPGSPGSHVQEIVDKFQGSPPPHEPALMAAQRCINDFLALSSANIRTGPQMNIRDGSFKLNLALINMVQQSPFYAKASEDANAHLQQFLEICSTFTILEVTQDAVRHCLFPFSLLGKVKQWFYYHKEASSTWEKCSNAFLTMFFHWTILMPSGTRPLGFSNSWMGPSPRHGNACRIILLLAPITAWKSGSSSKASIMS
jgi:hypothetical protein